MLSSKASFQSHHAHVFSLVGAGVGKAVLGSFVFARNPQTV